MKTMFLSAVAALTLLVGAANPTPAKAEPAFALAHGLPGIGISAFLFATIAYCEATLERDANGNVVKQNPRCSGGGPVVIGSTTVNPYNTVAKPCTRDPKRGWQCPS